MCHAKSSGALGLWPGLACERRVRRQSFLPRPLPICVDHDVARCETGELKVRSGKGRKARVVFAGSAAAALADWLEVRGDVPGRLFLPVNRGGNIRGEGMTAQAVYNVLEKRVREARLGKPLTPHDLRRSMIGDALDAGTDLSTVQKVAGHADPGTTARYDRRGVRAVRRVSEELLHVPYVPRSQRHPG